MLNYKASLLFIVLSMGISSFLLKDIHISNTPSSYVPPEMPSRVINDQLKKEFRNSESLYIIFESENALAKERLEKYSKLVKKIEELELTRKVFSIFNYEHIQGNEEGFEVGEIIKHSDIGKVSEKSIQEKILKDKYVKELFITSDFKSFGILIEPKVTDQSITRLDFENTILKFIEEEKLNDELVAVGGNFAIDTAQFRELMRTMKITIPITFAISIILLFLLFNSFKAVLLGIAMNSVITNIVLSLFPLFTWSYNMASAMIPTLMMALTIAVIVHLYNSIHKNKELGLEHEECIKKSVEEIHKPTLYSALTTAAGLFSLAASPIPPIRNIGVTGGIGVFIIFFVVIYILPPLLIRFDNGGWKQNPALRKFIDLKLNILMNVTLKHPKASSAIILIALILTAPLIMNVRTESNLFKFFSEEHFVNKSNNKIQDSFTGTTIVDVVLDSENESQLISTNFLTKLKSLQVSIEEIPSVTRVFSHANVFEEINWAFNNENEKFRIIPSSDELLEQYLFVYDGEDIFDFLRRDQKRAKINLNLNVQGANEIGIALKKIENLVKNSMDGIVNWSISGQGKLFSDQEDLMMSGIRMSLLWSLVIIFILMLVLWKSLPSTFLCMIPNVSPIIVMFITMGIFDIWLDFGTAMISSVTVGIAIDDTIHIFHGVKKRILQGLSIDDALVETYQESGRAVVITTIVLTAQFIILGASEFTPLKNFGLLTALGLFTALVFDLILLPALVKLSYRYLFKVPKVQTSNT